MLEKLNYNNWMILLKKIYDNHHTVFNSDFENEFTITELNRSIKGLYSNTYNMVQLFVKLELLDCNIQPYKKLYCLSKRGDDIGYHVSEMLRLVKKYKLNEVQE